MYVYIVRFVSVCIPFIMYLNWVIFLYEYKVNIVQNVEEEKIVII